MFHFDAYLYCSVCPCGGMRACVCCKHVILRPCSLVGSGCGRWTGVCFVYLWNVCLCVVCAVCGTSSRNEIVRHKRLFEMKIEVGLLTVETLRQSLKRNSRPWGCMGSTDWLTSISHTCHTHTPQQTQEHTTSSFLLIFVLHLFLPFLRATACCTR